MNDSHKRVRAVLIAALFAAAASASARAEEQDWTGARVAVGVGAGMSVGHVNDPDCYQCTNTVFSDRLIQAGASGGYDRQFGSAVLGLGVEVGLGSQHHTETISQRAAAASRQQALSKISWTAALLARAGVAARSTLFYVTAGPALARVEGSVNDAKTGAAAYRAAFSSWQPAFKGGVGIEHMIGRHAYVQAQYSSLIVKDRTAVGHLGGSLTTARSVFANSQSVATLGAGWRF